MGIRGGLILGTPLYIISTSILALKEAREDRYLQITIFLFPFLQEGIIQYPTRLFLDVRLQSALLAF
jgi:hypothetical protein